MPNEELKLECPYCHHEGRQVKAGLRDGVQRYRCQFCNRRYSPQPKHRGIAGETREQALELHATGLSASEIARRLGLKPRSISNWVHAAAAHKVKDSTKAIDLAGNGAAPLLPSMKANGRKVHRATIHDVAALANVSTSTVSNYLNGKGRMGEATRGSIRSAITQLHFAPNSWVRAIRERKSHILGIVTFGLGDLGDYRQQPIVVGILGGINRVAGQRGYNILLYTAQYDSANISDGTIFLDGKIDGLIWVGPQIGEPQHAHAARAGLPVMGLLAREDMEGVGYVDIDNVKAMEQVVAHLVEQGHRRIAYASSTINQPFLDRLKGYRQGLMAARIPWEPALVAANKAITRCWFRDGRTKEYEVTIDRWLAMPDPPTAIVLTTDGWARWVMDYLAKRGIRVPEDIAVTGFDDTDQAANSATILTSVSQDFETIGQLGAEGVINMIDGASCEECRKLLTGKLVVRQSSGRPRIDSTN